MSEELYTTTLPNGQTFRCVKSQLEKSGGCCPVHGHEVFPEMVARNQKFKQMKLAKLKAEVSALEGGN